MFGVPWALQGSVRVVNAGRAAGAWVGSSTQCLGLLAELPAHFRWSLAETVIWEISSGSVTRSARVWEETSGCDAVLSEVSVPDVSVPEVSVPEVSVPDA